MIPPPAVPKCRLWAGQVVSPSALCQRAPSQEVMLATNPLGSITPTLYLLGKACAPARSSDRVCSFTSTLACLSNHIRLGLSMAYVLGGECRGAGMYPGHPWLRAC